MKFTLSWLKEHLETGASLAEITEALTRVGLEVEGVDDPAARLAGFSIAHVVSAEQHPNADRLRVCMVDTGAGEPVQVVCGAPNARAGMKSVFSPPGTYIPGKGITLAIGTIRGVESRGMLCSAAELEISEDHDGIIVLPTGAGEPGDDAVALLWTADEVLDIDVTPDHPIGTTTVKAIHSGALYGFGGLVDRMVEVLSGQLTPDRERARTIATGGMAELIKPYTKTIDEIDTELTLTGLQLIYGLNCQGKDA